MQSARAVMAALRQAGHDVVPIGITPDGRWLAGGDPLHALSSGHVDDERSIAMLAQPGQRGLVPVQPSAPEALPITDLDVLFPVLHGTYGEDGTVQGLFELAAVPYAGAGVLGSALGMDKVVQKTLWRGLGLPVTDFLSVTRRELEDHPNRVVSEIEETIGYPCFTKPANLGSSVGVSKATTREDLERGLLTAAQYDAKLIVEVGIDARELEVGVLGNDEPRASVVGEIIAGAEFYDYRAKYLDNGSQAIIPADIPTETADQVRKLAIAAFKALSANGLARVDFFLERGSDRLLLNEINTMPGFTNISMYPKLWEASGVPFPELVTRIAELAIERYQERSRNRTSYSAE